MARRKSTAGDISLFPFLSIIVCIIGLLTLMIAGSSMTEMSEKPDEEAVARTTEYRRLQALLAADEAHVAKLDERLSSAGLGEARLAAAQKQLDLAKQNQQSRDAQSKEVRAAQTLQSRLAELQDRLAKLVAELKARTELAETLDKEIEQKGRPPEAAVSIRPTGTGEDLDAVFVECTDAGIVILESDEPPRIRREDLGSDPTFLELLDRTAASAKGIVIFLLRDNGTASYWSARSVADARGSRNGKIPVIGHGRIDLSRVRKAKR